MTAFHSPVDVLTNKFPVWRCRPRGYDRWENLIDFEKHENDLDQFMKIAEIDSRQDALMTSGDTNHRHTNTDT